MASNEIISLDAKLYYSATLLSDGVGASDVSITWVEIDNVADVEVSMTRDTVDASTRASKMRRNVATLGNVSINFTIDADTSKAWWSALKTAWDAGTPIALTAVDGDETVAGADGPAANFMITDFSRNEPLDGQLTYSVSAAVHEYYEWYTSA